MNPKDRERERELRIRELRQQIEDKFNLTGYDEVDINVGRWNRKTFSLYNDLMPEYKFLRLNRTMLTVRRSTMKERTITQWKLVPMATSDLLQRAKNGEKFTVRAFGGTTDEMCILHLRNSKPEGCCVGCPMASKSGKVGCTNVLPYKDIVSKLYRRGKHYDTVVGFILNQEDFLELENEFVKYIEFYSNNLEYIQGMDDRYFTETGWRYFKNLVRG